MKLQGLVAAIAVALSFQGAAAACRKSTCDAQVSVPAIS